MDQVLIKDIPPQIVSELATFGPFDLKKYIQVAEGAPALHFKAEVKDGGALPKGLICMAEGVITGIPAKETRGAHVIVITAENAELGSTKVTFTLTIKEAFTSGEQTDLDQFKTQVWEALKNQTPLPELADIISRPITKMDIYYILERWGIITIWDAFNLDPPTQKVLLNLPGVSPHYQVFDRGSSLIGCPKDLYSHERTLEDGLATARAMAKEVYKRNWTIEMAGLHKLLRAAWIEIQLLGDQHGKRLEIINYTPSPEDLWLYNSESANAPSERLG